ncbi:MAG: 23S rRNA (guanosine(2251)-2'-O)-methyltransferase RlmB [Ignavibacteriaceae bacterium]
MNLIIGRKPVLEALNTEKEIEQVLLLYGQEGRIIDAIRIAAKKRGIIVKQLPQSKFNQFVKNKNSQGVAAVRGVQKQFTPDQIISHSKKSDYPLLLVLDSIQDTHNFGAIIRTAECAGADGVIYTRHHSAPLNETVIKTSAGATEHIRLCPVNNLANVLEELKANNFWIVGTSLTGGRVYTEIDYRIPLAIVIGNEQKGIRRLTAEKCDFLVYIPMKGKMQSLNVSVAAGVLLFEIDRQRGINISEK